MAEGCLSMSTMERERLALIRATVEKRIGQRDAAAQAYQPTWRACILAHGRPLALYSDRHGIFRVNIKEAESGDGKTAFGRVVERLGIEPINANTPQAKGRGNGEARLPAELARFGAGPIELIVAVASTAVYFDSGESRRAA